MSSLCGQTLSKTRLSSNIAISQSASFENVGNVLFISLTIDFSSFVSFSSSLLFVGCCPMREGEITVRVDDWDGVGDGDREGMLAVAPFCLDFKLGYLDDNFLILP